MRKLIILSFISCFAFSFGIANLSAKGYGQAGCGLGSIIITGNGIEQIFATTTNGTLYNQTFGISSGTSGCTKDGIVQTEKAQEIFVHMNYESLEQEIAKGQGEKLSNLASLFGCPKDSKRFQEVAKENYSRIFTSASLKDPSLVLTNLRSQVGSDLELKNSCKI
ncbi:PF11220 family protein [Leptospira broomii serovar Hurstbridge str. 5399]|uniref:PF11220 family protein n=1 Tax=Leptospira broomii serovar Hurstbridge str. 5399 TaxID=1049789 RepID=T0FCT0_9LEPT|nr:DUF3015 domain-containing protein [Leptospira broomii]EQA45666.1 PF11220 family protein [Leptospira broomii serovar Hurstbridge str. 5399]